MNASEAALLCRYVRAACPAQAVDELTPDVWGDLLADVRFEDCKLAARNLGQNQVFIAPAEIRAEVRRIRNQRIIDYGALPDPPATVADDPAATIEWQRSTRRAIADGDPPERQVKIASVASSAVVERELETLREQLQSGVRTGTL